MTIDPKHHPEYVTPDASTQNPWTWGRVVTSGIGLTLLLGVVVFILLPSMGRARQTAQVIKCGSCLRQIGQALLLYAIDNGGAYPDRVEELVVSTDLGPEVFVCPSSDEERALAGATAQQTLANMYREPGHCSYIYLGKGMGTFSPSQSVVAFEPLGHHPPELSHRVDGSNVLFGDGAVIYVDTKDMQKLIAEINAGTNPGPTAKSIHP